MERTRMSRAGNGRCVGTGTAGGFTLVELLVVMTVMAAVAALATPMLDRVAPRLELRAAAQDLGTALRAARSAALRDNRETVVLIDVERRLFRTGSAGPASFLPEGTALTLLTATRERLDEARGRVRFYPDGTSTGGEVRLRRGSADYTVGIDWFDGTVRVHGTES